MKKLFSFLFVLFIAIQLFAQPDTKEILGKWKYTVDTGGNLMTGVVRIAEVDGKLTGDATVEGYTIPFTKIEYKEDKKLVIEMKTEADEYKIDVKVDGNKFSGMGSSYQGEAPITGEKMPE
ncbi:MAG: hypothetical protein AB7S72_11140 [Draconibacterium sp.]